jgi:hypothetical protein
MAENNSVMKKNSRYVSGGETEVNKIGLEWWERSVIERAADDIIFVVDATTTGRIDRIAHVFLGDTRLWWVIAQMNNLLDVYADITEGTVLYIPSKERVKLMLNGKTGGIPTTRVVKTTVLPIV